MPEAVSAIPVRSEDLVKPLMCRAVLGEEDDAAVVPLAVRSKVGFDPFDNRTAFRIRLVTGALRPIAQPGKQAQFFLSRRSAAFRGFLDRFVLRGLRLSVVRIILFRFEDRLPQDAVCHCIRFLCGFASGQGAVSVFPASRQTPPAMRKAASSEDRLRNWCPDAPAFWQVFSRLLQYESRTL